MVIYHGSTETITLPLAKAGRPDLDFGQGFYTTDMLEQAQIWADRMHRQRHEPAVVNVYEFDKEIAMKEYRYLKFDDYDILWLDFIALCRTGNPIWKEYDCIEGGIAKAIIYLLAHIRKCHPDVGGISVQRGPTMLRWTGIPRFARNDRVVFSPKSVVSTSILLPLQMTVSSTY